MKKKFGFIGLASWFFSTEVASAHGLHEELLEGIEHMQVHMMQNGVALIGTASAVFAGYILYRLMIAEEE